MKYIVVRVRNGEIVRELPFIFPDAMVHKDIYAMVERSLYFHHNANMVDCASAGFISSTKIATDGGCHGHSESLGVASRGEEDDKLFPLLDYNHGLKL